MMYAAVIHKYTALAVEKIRRLVALGLDARQLQGLNEDGFFGFARRIRSDLLYRRQRMVDFGRGQVNEEIKRQRGDEAESAA